MHFGRSKTLWKEWNNTDAQIYTSLHILRVDADWYVDRLSSIWNRDDCNLKGTLQYDQFIMRCIIVKWRNTRKQDWWNKKVKWAGFIFERYNITNMRAGHMATTAMPVAVLEALVAHIINENGFHAFNNTRYHVWLRLWTREHSWLRNSNAIH
jgi:hypothetical protein